MAADEAEWLRLQKKIFTRWVNQRLATRRLAPLGDVVADLHKGSNLLDLCEILSEQTGPKLAPAKFRAQEIENMNKTLKFVFESCGVQMSLKPSPENLLKGDEKDVLGLIWALMMKYLKFSSGDEDEGGEAATNAKDALLRWVQLNTAGYSYVDIKGFKGSFNSGMAFCALLHKFKPELINYAELNPANDKENLTIAMNTAEKWFGLEKYLAPSDIPKLDEKSMLVYVSEYYSGIIEQLKLDLAARRIKMLINFTVTNDELRAQFNRDAPALLAHAKDIERVLSTLAVKDNTLAGAKARLQQYKDHRAKEGRGIYNDEIRLEAVYTNLASRLADNNRPPFVCENPELRVDALVQRLDRLNDEEQKVVVALHVELSLQFRLQQVDSQHRLRHGTLMQWLQAQQSALPDVKSIADSGQARNALKHLEAYARESLAMKKSVEALVGVGKELRDYRFEGTATVAAREQEVAAKFAALDQLAAEQKPLFEDALQRQMFREQVHLSAKVFADLCRQLQAWGADQSAYLKVRETITSRADAELHLNLLEVHYKQKSDMEEGSVASLKTLGEEICSARFKTALSAWEFENPKQIKSAETSIDELWDTLQVLANEKQLVLDDHLHREEFADKTRLLAGQHTDKCNQLEAWVAEKKAYLSRQETVNTIADAHFHISVLEAYEKEMASMTATNYHSLRALGTQIRGREYKTEYSRYVYENNAEQQKREVALEKSWAELKSLSAARAQLLKDHLDRNVFQNKVRLWVTCHKGLFDKLAGWVAEKRAYLQTKEHIDSIQEARLQLGLLAAYKQDKTDLTSTVAALKSQGNDIRTAAYRTQFSSWQYEHIPDVTQLETTVSDAWVELTQLSDKKQAVLDDDLAREQFKERTRLWVRNHQEMFSAIKAWADEKLAYLNTKENISSVEPASQHLSLMNALQTSFQGMTNSNVPALRKLGDEIRAAKYATQYSEWVYEKPEEVTALETNVTRLWAEITEKSEHKRKVLEDDLAREQFKERTRLWVRNHQAMFAAIKAWADKQLAYLNTKEDIKSSELARQHLSSMDALRTSFQGMTDSNVPALRKLGDEIRAAKYATQYSQWVYEKLDEVTGLETNVAALWAEIKQKSEHKQKVLEDDLAREQFKEQTRLWVRNHEEMFAAIKIWADEQLAYLNTKEDIKSSELARQHLSQMDALRAAFASMTDSNVPALRKLGDEIRVAKYATQYSQWVYEKLEEVTGLEANVAALWAEIKEKSEHKQKVLEDDLARELFKEQTRLWVRNHLEMFNYIKTWTDEKLAYLHVKEVVRSSETAKQHLSLREVFVASFKAMTDSNVPALKKLGGDILRAKYETVYSSWVYEHPEEIKRLEQVVDQGWDDMKVESEAKKARLEDDLARESYAEHTRVLADQYKRKAALLTAWAADKLKYLKFKEDIKSSHDARVHLSLLEAYEKEMTNTTNTSLASLRALDAEIVARRYETRLSNYSYENVLEIRNTDAQLQKAWAELQGQSKTKLAILEDDFTRHEFKEKVELWASCFTDSHAQLTAWAEEKRKYLVAREEVDSVQKVELQLSLLEAYELEKADLTSGSLAALQALLGDVRGAKYQTPLSEWVYPERARLDGLEKKLLAMWTELTSLSGTKQAWLDDALLREQLRAKVYMRANQHAREHKRLDGWIDEKKEYLKTQEAVDSIDGARLLLRLLAAFDTEQRLVHQTTVVTLTALGNEVLQTAYKSDLSQWKYEDPNSITQRKAKVEGDWAEFATLLRVKKERLDKALECEITKENLRLEFAACAHGYQAFVKDNITFISARAVTRDPQSGMVGFTVDELDAYGKQQVAEDERLLREDTVLMAGCEEVLGKLAAFGAVKNPYTVLNREGLGQLREKLVSSLKARRAQFDEELERQLDDDHVCEEFGELANPLIKSMADNLALLIRPKGSLDQQLSLIVSLQDQLLGIEATLANLRTLESTILSRKIAFNRHCTSTAGDIEKQVKDYAAILTYKRPQLEQEIQYKRLKGVTPAQIAEIEAFFRKFDKDGSGHIDKKEMRSCLFTLGEELQRAEVERLVQQFGSNGQLNLAQFKQLMIHQLGVSHTQVNITQGFQYIARGRDDVQAAVLARYLTPAELAMITKTAPSNAEGILYGPWVEEVFSR